MSEEKPRNIINGQTTVTDLIDMCEGHAEEENKLIAQLFGKDRPPMNEEQRNAALERLETIQTEMALRDERLDKIGGPTWRGM